MMSEETSRTQRKKAYNHQRGGILSGGFHKMAFNYGRILGRRFQETVRDNDMGSQPAGPGFMEQLQEIVGHTHERPFSGNLHRSTQKKAAEFHILLGHGEGSLGLNTAIDPQELAHFCIHLRFHLFSLFPETFGDIDILAPFVHRNFAFALDALVL